MTEANVKHYLGNSLVLVNPSLSRTIAAEELLMQVNNPEKGLHFLVNSGAIIGASLLNSVKIKGRWSYRPEVGEVITDEVHLGANTVIIRSFYE